MKGCEEFNDLPAAIAHSDSPWVGVLITLRDNYPVPRVDLCNYLGQNKAGISLLFAGNLKRRPYIVELQYRVVGDLENTHKVMDYNFWIGVQPALTLAVLGFAARKIETYLDGDFR